MKSVLRIGLFVAALWGGAALAGDDWKNPSYGGSGIDDDSKSMVRADKGGADTGLYVLLGGGTEGYTGSNAGDLRPGFAYGATVGIKPSKLLGLELGYNGAFNDVDIGPGGAADGGDIMRQGGQAAVTVGLTKTKLQPYVMGGVGIQNYDVRGGSSVFGFSDDTSGYVPAGVGLRYNLGKLLTADARVNYNIPFAQEFAPDNGLDDGRYQGLLQLGGTY